MSTNYKLMTDSFEKMEINPAGFSHTDHVGVAYHMLKRYDFIEALYKYSRCIETIATRAGAAMKFNVTITVAFLSLISERMYSSHSSNFQNFIDNNKDLINDNPLISLYSKNRLSSEEARIMFLLPDLVI